MSKMHVWENLCKNMNRNILLISDVWIKSYVGYGDLKPVRPVNWKVQVCKIAEMLLLKTSAHVLINDQKDTWQLK